MTLMQNDDDKAAVPMDPHARRFLAMLSLASTDAGEVSAEDRRKSFEKLMRYARPPAEDVVTVDAVLRACGGGAIKLRDCRPTGLPDPAPALIYFHGGGLVAGDLDTHDPLCRTLAVGARCRVLAVDYRRPPEHRFPIPILDALVAVRTIVRRAAELGLDRSRIAVGGDSGGATLATIVARLLRGRLKAQVLLCPVLDFVGPHASRETFGQGYLLDAATMRRDLADYAPTRPPADAYVSPLRAARLEGMPPTFIHTAGYDPLRDEAEAYAKRLVEAGVPVTRTCHETLIHHFYGLNGIIPAATPALEAVAADIARALA